MAFVTGSGIIPSLALLCVSAASSASCGISTIESLCSQARFNNPFVGFHRLKLGGRESAGGKQGKQALQTRGPQFFLNCPALPQSPLRRRKDTCTEGTEKCTRDLLFPGPWQCFLCGVAPRPIPFVRTDIPDHIGCAVMVLNLETFGHSRARATDSNEARGVSSCLTFNQNTTNKTKAQTTITNKKKKKTPVARTSAT